MKIANNTQSNNTQSNNTQSSNTQSSNTQSSNTSGKKTSKYDKKNKNQIIRFDGKTTFIEIMNNAFSINRVLINFIEYSLNASTGKGSQTGIISIYLSFEKFLELKADILSGKMEKLRDISNKNGTTFTKPLVQELGGTSARSLKMTGKSRPDGKSLSRQFKLLGGNKFMFQAEIGAGNENKTGLIVPDGKPEKKISVALSGGDLKQLFLITEMHMNAFLASQYMKGEYDYKPFNENNK